jgi:hypothetical protein
MRFDDLANPERSIGRIALFDVLVQIGDKTTALTKAASWIGYWRKASIHRAAGSEIPAARLVRMMLAVDETAARRLICEVHRSEAPAPADDDHAPDGSCELTMPAEADNDTPANVAAPSAAQALTAAETRGELARRRRR